MRMYVIFLRDILIADTATSKKTHEAFSILHADQNT